MISPPKVEEMTAEILGYEYSDWRATCYPLNSKIQLKHRTFSRKETTRPNAVL
jgi:hypothetical protein